MTEIIPAIIPSNLNIVREKLSKLLGLVNKIQLDIVDGEYADVKTWPFNSNQFDEMLKITRGEEKFPYIDDFEIEIDLLTRHPIEYIGDFISLGAKSFVIHVDSTDHVAECLETVKNSGCKVGLGLRPSGDVNMLEPYLPQADFVQFMGNDRVGYNGVELDKNVPDKIKNFHDSHPAMPIQIDIGVNEETIPKLKKAGVVGFVSGSSIFNGPDIAEALARLQSS